MAALDVVNQAFPFVAQIGLSGKVVEWAAAGYNEDTILGLLRQEPAYRNFFDGIFADDGTMVMSEKEYLDRMDDLATVDAKYGRQTDRKTRQELIKLRVDPNEYERRNEIWSEVQKSGRAQQEAFYVYAGMRISKEDLYRAAVDPQEGEALQKKYDQGISAQRLDYQGWLQRAAEVGLERVVESLESLEAAGVATGGAVQRIRQVDPQFAKQMVDVIYHGGDPSAGNFLDFDSLMNAFESAMIGSAATENNLALPGFEQINAIRQAGVDRKQAAESYAQFAQSKDMLAGAAARANRGQFSQKDYEDAVFLNKADAQMKLQQALGSEKALSNRQGAAQMGQDRTTGQLTQEGLRQRNY